MICNEVNDIHPLLVYTSKHFTGLGRVETTFDMRNGTHKLVGSTVKVKTIELWKPYEVNNEDH